MRRQGSSLFVVVIATTSVLMFAAVPSGADER
jgi:hypothetical protein